MPTPKTILITGALLLTGFLFRADVQAQSVDRQYLSDVLAMTSKKNAAYYRVADGKDGELFIGKTYTLDGKLKAEGRYADPELSIENGEFIFYHANGKVESRGMYMMGRKSGIWERHDQWGRALAEKIYDPEPLANIIYTRAQPMPQYKGGDDRELVRYIKSKVTAPDGRKVRGEVTATFIVEKNGELSDVKVVEGENPGIHGQVVDAIKTTAPWEPGAEKGQPVRVQMRLPVQF